MLLIIHITRIMREYKAGEGVPHCSRFEQLMSGSSLEDKAFLRSHKTLNSNMVLTVTLIFFLFSLTLAERLVCRSRYALLFTIDKLLPGSSLESKASSRSFMIM